MYDALADTIDPKCKKIIFSLPLFPMEHLNDCSFIAIKSLLAFHQKPFVNDYEVSEDEAFIGNIGSLLIHKLLEKNDLRSLPVELDANDTLYTLLRCYGPLFYSLSPVTLQQIGFICGGDGQRVHHAIVVCGVDESNVYVLFPSMSQEVYNKHKDFLTVINTCLPSSSYALRGEPVFDTKIITINKKIFLQGVSESNLFTKPFYFQTEYTEPLVPGLTTQTIHTLNTMYNSLMSFFTPTTKEPLPVERKLFINAPLKQSDINQTDLQHVISSLLKSDRLLLKYHSRALKPSEYGKDIVSFFNRHNNDDYRGILEVVVKPGYENKIPDSEGAWKSDYFDFIEIKAFHPFSSLNEDSIDTKKNTYLCSETIHLGVKEGYFNSLMKLIMPQ